MHLCGSDFMFQNTLHMFVTHTHIPVNKCRDMCGVRHPIFDQNAIEIRHMANLEAIRNQSAVDVDEVERCI